MRLGDQSQGPQEHKHTLQGIQYSEYIDPSEGDVGGAC